MLKNVEDISNPASRGLNTVPNYLSLEKGQSPNMMDVKVNYDGSREKRLGSNTQNAVIIAASAGAGFSVNVSGTLTASLISYWKLDETSGTRFDSFGSNNLLDVNSTTFAGGIQNQAALFAAANSNALQRISNLSLLAGGTNFTISSWVYLLSTSTTLERAVVSKRDKGINEDATLLLHFDGASATTAFTDNSVYKSTIVVSGSAQLDSSQQKFGPTSGLFQAGGGPTNGTDFIYTAANSARLLGTSSFTVDFQFRPSTLANNLGIFGSQASSANWYGLSWIAAGNSLNFRCLSSNLVQQDIVWPWAPTANTWYHVSIVRNNTQFTAYINGSGLGGVLNSAGVSDFGVSFDVGRSRFLTGLNVVTMSGWLDEFRATNGTATWQADFTAPGAPYTNATSTNNYEYYLYINTDNIPVFKVSTDGRYESAKIAATSFGALGTSTWYNLIGWVDSTNSFIGISVNRATNSASFTSTVLAGSAPLTIGSISDGLDGYFDGRIDETTFWKKAIVGAERTDIYNSGTGNTYQTAFDTQPWACFDFGASSLRWLVAAAGTGIYASSNLGLTWLTIATDRTASYQYFERSKNVLVATSDAYDNNLYWSGSAGTYGAWLNSNSTASRFSINFQGFLITLNSSARKRGFFYQDENSQLTGTWANNFDIPSSLDDEVTAAFILRRYLYISTRYKLFRINYVGGNPDWQVIELKNWGFVPRTVKRIVLTNPTPGIGLYYSVGEIAIGLTWDKKIRVFDGSNDQIISNPIELDNGQCDYALSKISYLGSGPVISFAETDLNANVYKLITSVGGNSTRTTHMLNYDGRAFAFYPYSRQNFNCMCMADSAYHRFLMAFDRSGYCHMLDSGNLDGNTTSINEIYDSPLIFDKSPSQSTKGHRVDLFFSNTTSGQIYFQDRVDFGNTFTTRKVFTISGSAQKIIHYESIDVPETFNTYQWRITTSSGTSAPYRLLRDDYFVSGLGIGKND